VLETVILIVAAVNVGFMAAWLTTGAVENVVHPELNEAFTSGVLDMTKMREEWPEAYRHVAYRRISARWLQIALFRVIVAWELLAMAGLWVGTAALILATFGASDGDIAIALGLIGALLFTTTWSAFLVGGN